MFKVKMLVIEVNMKSILFLIKKFVLRLMVVSMRKLWKVFENFIFMVVGDIIVFIVYVFKFIYSRLWMIVFDLLEDCWKNYNGSVMVVSVNLRKIILVEIINLFVLCKKYFFFCSKLRIFYNYCNNIWLNLD